jgi:CRP-like cAMP-binding protein
MAVPGWPSGTVLAALEAADRDALLALGEARVFFPGEALIRTGLADTACHLLLRGCTKVVGGSADGRAVLLSFRVAGDLVGELAALDGGPRSASVVAATPVSARTLRRPALLRYMAERPDAAGVIHRAVIAELRRATRHRIDVNAAPTATRLALVLDRLAEAYGQRCPAGVRIDVPLSQAELASLVGVSEPTLCRALTGLRERKVIRTGYRHVVVSDPPALRALAQSEERL